MRHRPHSFRPRIGRRPFRLRQPASADKFITSDKPRGWSAKRRTGSFRLAAFPFEECGRLSGRSIAVPRLRLSPETQAPGPRFLGRGTVPVPVQRSSFAEGS